MSEITRVSEMAHLAESIEGLFTASNFYWYVSYPAAVEGLTAQQAAAVPAPRFNSVWAVTLHLTVCQRFGAAVLSRGPVDPMEFFAEGAWPPVRDPNDETAWEQAKAAVLEANHALAQTVAGLNDEMLDRELINGMRTVEFIHGHLTHLSHHLSEIVTIRHMQGLWLERT